MSASSLESLLFEPDTLTHDHAHQAWFDAIARRLLCGCRLLVAGVPHRLTEVEVYYHGGAHLDVFAHCDPVQKATGRWYFHRTRGVYRGGSFKGLDLTFGGPASFGGVLFRGMEQEGGPLLDGPSLCVDHLLRLTRHPNVAALDTDIAGRAAWVAGNLLRLEWADEIDRPILRTARVGLTLKRLRKAEPAARFVLAPYRYLTEPRRISKGKLQMALALHAVGVPLVEIRERTNCTAAALGRYIADFEGGKSERNFDRYLGLDLGPKDLARLHGLWWKTFGTSG